MPSNCWKFYREIKKIKDKNISQRSLHEELKESFYSQFVSTLNLFRKNNPEQQPT